MGLAVDELQISMSAGLGEYGGTHTGGNLAVDVVSGKTGSAKEVKEKNKDNDQMRERRFFIARSIKSLKIWKKSIGPILIESLLVED